MHVRPFAILIVALLVPATGAMANPYRQDSVGLAAPAAPQSCQTRLANHSYACRGVTSFGQSYTDTFTFSAPGSISATFDLFTTELGISMGCACRPTGSLAHPKFDQSFAFECVGPIPGSSDQIAFSGTASATKITKGQATNSHGDTFVFTCVEN